MLQRIISPLPFRRLRLSRVALFGRRVHHGHVLTHVLWINKSGGAQTARVGAPPRVFGIHVTLEEAAPRKTLAAIRTTVGFFAAVCSPDMGAQILALLIYKYFTI